MPTNKSPLKLENLPAQTQAHVRNLMRAEFTAFFTKMTETPTPQWPAISSQELVNAIADSLLTMGTRQGMPLALLQTLVHELQDRVNDAATKSPR